MLYQSLTIYRPHLESDLSEPTKNICYISGTFENWLDFDVIRNIVRATLVAQTVKRLPTMRETRVRSRGREDPLEKEMAPHSSILAWKIPWIEEPGRLQSMGSQRVGYD